MANMRPIWGTICTAGHRARPESTCKYMIYKYSV